MEYALHIFELIKQYNLLPQKKPLTPDCLFISEKCFSIDSLKPIWELHQDGKSKNIRGSPEFRKLASLLRNL